MKEDIILYESGDGKNYKVKFYSIGYSLGNEAIKNNWNEEELLNNVINAANNGKLYMLK